MMMFRNFFVLVVLGSFCGFLYGIWSLFTDIEDNWCRMTYMFGQPQFSRVKIKENKQFSDYGLYYYYEGQLQRDVNVLRLNGAPVIFIPGNGGSYKQARSLASVALRKGLEHEHQIHLDYFTIDYNEELSGLYGGYLENQRRFLKICIKTVLRLYTDTASSARRVVLIGHSMGGKLAQAILTDADMVHYINSNIFISSPLDKPVVNLDAAMNEFYENTTAFLYHKRALHVSNRETNFCGTLQAAHPAVSDLLVGNNSTTTTGEVETLANILLISIGGGNRDVLVRAGLTTSIFSDIHAMTSSIPNVWLSCDHLASVWCLQLVLVINRFLFSITTKDANGYVLFKEDRSARLQAASSFFVKQRRRTKKSEVEFATTLETWAPKERLEHPHRVFRRQFRSGLRQTYNEMIPLDKYEKFKKLYVEVINMEDQEWIFGCAANVLTDGKYACEKGTSLSHYIQNIPSNDILRSAVLLDLHKIQKTYANWTHILVRLPPTKKPVFFNVDIHAPIERISHIAGPRWFTFKARTLFGETGLGTVYYKIQIPSLSEPYQGLQVNIEPRGCSGKKFHVTAKICVPWARGFDRYEVLTEASGKNVVYVNAPTSNPRGYNTTTNPIVVELFLDPSCRYSISHQFSVSTTMSKTVQEFVHWLPAHLIAVLLIVLKNQISRFHSDVTSKSRMPCTGFFQSSSFYIVTGCRIFKLLTPVRATADISNESMYGSAVVHSIAIAVSIIMAFGVWVAVIFNGNFMYKTVLRLTGMSFVASPAVVSMVTALPITFGVLAVAFAYGCCSGLALLLACIVYFIMMANTYKENLENCFWETASNLMNPSRTVPNDPAAAAADESTLDGNPELQTLNNSNQTPLAKNPEVDQRQGLQNFTFHITLLLMLCILAGLNFAVTLAWLRNYKSGQHRLPDPALVPTVIALGSLSLLWQLKAPNKLLCHHFTVIVLYVAATCCIIFCQEAVYRLNYVVAFVFLAILAHELLCKMWNWFCKRPEVN